MTDETIFRVIMVLAFIAMMGIRVYYQSKVLRDQDRIEMREGPVSLIAGSVAALTTIVFGAEYILSPGSFQFAYVLQYPLWLRWFGCFMLAGGITLLGLAHHHLGRSFHSLVVSKENLTLAQTGPYRWIRHPIYTAYIANYISGGLLASNVVLTFVPVAMFAILVTVRMSKEEDMLRDRFGDEYVALEKRTGRLCPRIRRKQ